MRKFWKRTKRTVSLISFGAAIAGTSYLYDVLAEPYDDSFGFVRFVTCDAPVCNVNSEVFFTYVPFGTLFAATMLCGAVLALACAYLVKGGER